jgi:uncharacterized protein YcbK (DUF882 family)
MMSVPPTHPARRLFLRRSAQFAVAGVTAPLAARPALASRPDARSLAMDHTHTGESLTLVYAMGDQYVPDALRTLNHFLRDHYSGDIGLIDPQLFDLLHRVKTELGARRPFQVISGYRCPTTNQALRTMRGGGVATRSLHMDGKAIDIRLPGVPLSELRDAAMSLRAGGVGYYPREQFVHVDTGSVRSW